MAHSTLIEIVDNCGLLHCVKQQCPSWQTGKHYSHNSQAKASFAFANQVEAEDLSFSPD